MVNLLPALILTIVVASPDEGDNSQPREAVTLPPGFFQGELVGGVEQRRLLPYQLAPGQRVVIIRSRHSSRRQYRALPEPDYPHHEWAGPQPDVLRHPPARSQE